MTTYAPIALFTYNRPDHTAATLDALAQNELASESDLVVFCDGPRTPDQAENTERVRAVARATKGFRSVRVVERNENFGLARSIITGVTEVLEEYESIIVLEDDLLTSPYFLSYMNEGLGLYAGDDRVLSLCGYAFPVERPMPETYFLRGAFCWGWATWRRGWALYEHDAATALREIIDRDLIYEFDFKGSDPLTLILQMSVINDARADSWATRWMASACIHDKLTLFPGRSLVANAGFDGSGRHANYETRYATPMADRCPRLGTIPVDIDPEVIAAHRALFLHWRIGNEPKRRLFYRVTGLLPEAFEKRIYTFLVHRWLRKSEKAGRSVLQG